MSERQETPTDVMSVGPLACGACSASLSSTRYVHVEAWSVYTLCSAECFRGVVRACRRARWAARKRAAEVLSLIVILLIGLATPHDHLLGRPRVVHPLPVTPPTAEPIPARLPPGWYGPEWPPTEISFLAALGQDAWIHPLSGPVRRMPRADSRVFGAARPGERPAECRNGHCGVDLGGEIWGEHVHAVHDGVVDFVQRGANPDRGGEFVRLAHRDGTVFTQYFHLAAIPRGLERGVRVKSGDVIGLLGDTGVKASAPHLHFAMSIRPSKEAHERYIDPEPLIALWPLRVPVDGSEVGLVTTLGRPGLPLGSATLSRSHKRASAKVKKGGRRGGADEEPRDPDDGSSAASDDASGRGASDEPAAGETDPDSPAEPTGGGD